MALEGDRASWGGLDIKLAEALDTTFRSRKRLIDGPFLMPVEDVYSISGRGTVVTGRVERGIVKVGEELEIVGLKPTLKTVCTGVEMFRKLLDQGQAGDNVGVLSIFLVKDGRRWVHRIVGFQPTGTRRAPRARPGAHRQRGAQLRRRGARARHGGRHQHLHRAQRSSACRSPCHWRCSMAFFDLIPLVGSTIGGVLVGVVTVFGDFPGDTIIWVICVVAYQQVENSVFQPIVYRRAVEPASVRR